MSESSGCPMCSCIYIIVGVYVVYKLIKWYVDSIKGVCTSQRTLEGKTVIVTGGSAGIGYGVASGLAARKAKVYIAAYDEQQGERAAQAIRESTGNTQVFFRHVNLSEMSSVRQFVEKFKEEENSLDVLVNNAGCAGKPYIKTSDGLEYTFATNFFGPFLLTNLLLDMLKQSVPSRIVNTTSVIQSLGKIKFDNLNSEKYHSFPESYFNSKLAIVLFTRELCKRLQGTGVTANVLHPGSVNTDFFDDFPFIIRIPLKFISSLFFKSIEEGAQTSIYLAVSEEVEGVSGKYFMDCKPADEGARGKDDGVAKKLWEVAEKSVGLA